MTFNNCFEHTETVKVNLRPKPVSSTQSPISSFFHSYEWILQSWIYRFQTFQKSLTSVFDVLKNLPQVLFIPKWPSKLLFILLMQQNSSKISYSSVIIPFLRLYFKVIFWNIGDVPHIITYKCEKTWKHLSSTSRVGYRN